MCNLFLAALAGVLTLGSCAMVICVVPSFAKTRGGIVRAIEAMSSCKYVEDDFSVAIRMVAAMATSFGPIMRSFVISLKLMKHAEKESSISLIEEAQFLTQSLLGLSWTAFSLGVGWHVGAFLAPIFVNGPRVVILALKYPALGLIEDVATMVRPSPAHD